MRLLPQCLVLTGLYGAGPNAWHDFLTISSPCSTMLLVASYVDPPLTTVRQRKYEMGRLAMEMLLNILSGEEATKSIVLQGELIVRKSCQALSPAP